MLAGLVASPARRPAERENPGSSFQFHARVISFFFFVRSCRRGFSVSRTPTSLLRDCQPSCVVQKCFKSSGGQTF